MMGKQPTTFSQLETAFESSPAASCLPTTISRPWCATGQRKGAVLGKPLLRAQAGKEMLTPGELLR